MREAVIIMINGSKISVHHSIAIKRWTEILLCTCISVSQSLRSLRRIQSLLMNHSLHSRHFQRPKQGEQNWEEVQKTYAKETKLGGNAKFKEQKEGVRWAEEMLALNPRHFTECPQTCRTPLGHKLSHENQWLLTSFWQSAQHGLYRVCSRLPLFIKKLNLKNGYTQGVQLRLIQAPMQLNFSLWRPDPEN